MLQNRERPATGSELSPLTGKLATRPGSLGIAGTCPASVAAVGTSEKLTVLLLAP